MKTVAISNTINGVKTIVETNATTLGELKTYMDEHNISYPSDALWYSGLTKSRLEFDNSEFLSDNPRTCNVNGEEKVVHGVILIVPSKNKIESGMTRGEAYLYIRENNLAEEIKDTFGKNYTNVPTDDLVEFINTYDDEPVGDGDDPCDMGCEIPVKTPIDVLKFIHHALGATIAYVESKCENDCSKECSQDDLDKMLIELQQQELR